MLIRLGGVVRGDSTSCYWSELPYYLAFKPTTLAPLAAQRGNKRQLATKGLMMCILRLPAVLNALGYRSHASIYNAVKVGLFTKPVPLGLRSVGWPDEEVETIAAARIAGQSDEQLRDLVQKLHTKRVERFAEISGAL